MYASCRHLFISSASLSWMVVNFLNQNIYIPSWPGIFQLDVFLRVALSKWMCISAFGSSSSFSNSFAIFLIHSAFLLVAIFYSKIIPFLLHPVVGMFSCYHPQLVAILSFRCLGMSCFVCFILPFLFHLSFYASTFWFISSSCIGIFSCDVFFFLFVPTCSRPFPLFYNFCLFL